MKQKQSEDGDLTHTDSVVLGVLIRHKRLHQPINGPQFDGCMCGWKQWSGTHAVHVLEELAKAGVVITVSGSGDEDESGDDGLTLER